MARKLEKHDFSGRGRVPKGPRFPEEWFNGEVWEAVRGEDFNTTASSFRSILSEEAKRFHDDMKVRGNVYPKEVPQRVVFQAYKPEPEAEFDS